MTWTSKPSDAPNHVSKLALAFPTAAGGREGLSYTRSALPKTIYYNSSEEVKTT
jgi:hypothetical protein